MHPNCPALTQRFAVPLAQRKPDLEGSTLIRPSNVSCAVRVSSSPSHGVGETQRGGVAYNQTECHTGGGLPSPSAQARAQAFVKGSGSEEALVRVSGHHIPISVSSRVQPGIYGTEGGKGGKGGGGRTNPSDVAALLALPRPPLLPESPKRAVV